MTTNDLALMVMLAYAALGTFAACGLVLALMQKLDDLRMGVEVKSPEVGTGDELGTIPVRRR